MILKFTFLSKESQIYICADSTVYCPEWYKKAFNEEFLSIRGRSFNDTCQTLIKILHDAFMEEHLSITRQDSFIVFLSRTDDETIKKNERLYQFVNSFSIRKESMT